MEKVSYTHKSLSLMHSVAVSKYKRVSERIQKLKKIRPGDLDTLVHTLHKEEFNKIDCLECANCCKTISPAIYDSDLRRMAAALKIKTVDFEDTYLFKDGMTGYVFKKTPCPFLEPDNYCSIYAARPKACREYPHTDRKRIYQILTLTAKNSKVCPAVFNMVGQL